MKEEMLVNEKTGLFGRVLRRLESSPSEDLAELGQTRVRMAILVVIVTYTIFHSLIGTPDHILESWAVSILTYFAFYTPVALALLLIAGRYPGNYPARRLFSMMNDYAALGYTIAVGGPVMLPFYAVIVWVTVGNGLRYGHPYMIIASVMAQATLLAITIFSPTWQESPALVFTLSLTVFIVPFYAQRLLRSNEAARKEAQDANLAKSRFLAQASHDLRQPVHAIGLFLHHLKNSGLRPDQQSTVARIDRSLHGVASLFKSLLDISTLDSGALVPSYEAVPIQSLFEELEHQNRSSAAWVGSNLRFIPTQYVVWSDRALLSTMVQNLISNAVKYAPNRPILVGCRRQNQAISIAIYDCGDGIEAEHIPHLFEEFYQVRKIGSPDTQGVGLGLSIVKRLAMLLGLVVIVRSREGYGTSVTISGLTANPASSAGTATPLDKPGDQWLRGVRIILIEDDRDVLDATAELLESWGCSVQAFLGAPQQVRDCDLIIADFDIGGGVTGWESIISIRDALSLHVPAIVMTGHDENRLTQIIDQPDVPILKKPVDPSELRRKIFAADLLERRAELGREFMDIVVNV